MGDAETVGWAAPALEHYREESLPERMLALIKPSPAPGMAWADVPVPRPQAGELLVRVIAAGICGSDLAILHWKPWFAERVAPGRVVGHEFAGVVLESRDERFEPGAYVAMESHIPCGTCETCRAGRSHVCPKVRLLGIDVDGGFAPYVAVPASVAWRLDPLVPPVMAAIHEPLGNAVHATHKGRLVGARVLVTGAGPQGLFATAVARQAGAERVVVVEPRLSRRQAALALGADEVLDTDAGPDGVLRALGGVGAHLTVEMSGNPSALALGLACTTPAGDVSLLGIPDTEVTVDLSRSVISRGLTLHGVFGREFPGTWELVTSLVEGGLDLRPAISHVLPFDRALEGMELAGSNESTKIVLVDP